SISTAAQLRPISPRPPRKVTETLTGPERRREPSPPRPRSPPTHVRAGGGHRPPAPRDGPSPPSPDWGWSRGSRPHRVAGRHGGDDGPHAVHPAEPRSAWPDRPPLGE